MTAEILETCQAPWGCNSLTSKAERNVRRRIGSTELCNACYKYLFNVATDEMGLSFEALKELFLSDSKAIRPPRRVVLAVPVECSRKGCFRILKPDDGPEKRRYVGNMVFCRNCYQAVWKLSRERKISLEKAVQLVSPKGGFPKPKSIVETVECAMIWCANKANKNNESALSPTVFVCGECRKGAGRYVRRFNNVGNWRFYAQKMFTGELMRYGDPEQCSLSWCTTIERPNAYGPNGEAICNADSAYLYNYAKRNGVSKDDAYRQAPEPQLNKMRVRGRELMVVQQEPSIMTEEELQLSTDRLRAQLELLEEEKRRRQNAQRRAVIQEQLDEALTVKYEIEESFKPVLARIEQLRRDLKAFDS